MNQPTQATQASPATAPKPRKAADKSARTRAREFAVQALYQHLVGRNGAAEIDLFTRELSGFHKADSAHYDALLHGCIASATELDAALAPLLDRPLIELSPVEHAVLWIGAYELQHGLDVPWRVVLNECIELAKSFGGTDGHKYVNGVLNQLAPQWRSAEVQRDAATRPSRTAAQARPEYPESAAPPAEPAHAPLMSPD
ncbi:MAG: hypothetical protein JM57_07330 [Comamonadaceae bacterium BICA1-1]|nr:MAG: hypothetical protein JM57_07330 [Comamonadaceae bacterium BICA1-1]